MDIFKSIGQPNTKVEIKKIPRDWFSIFLSAIAIIISGLAAYFVFIQTKDTTKAANAAELAAKTAMNQFSYQRNQDSINRIIQNTKEISFALSQEQRDSINLENTIIDLRPYLVVSNIDWFLSSPDLYAFNVEIKNVGKTPAYNVCLSKIKISFNRIFDENDAHQMYIDTTLSIVIGTGMSSIVPDSTNRSTISHYNDYKGYYILGKITYKDTFKRSHFVQFCGWQINVMGIEGFTPIGNLNKAD